MKLIEKCKRCQSKGSMLKIFTILYYELKKPIMGDQGENSTYEYQTHRDLVAFYICKNCIWLDTFQYDPIKSMTMVSIYIIPDYDIESLKNIKSQKNPKCLYCEQYTHPINPQEGEKTKPAVTKLHLKPNREFIGYFCLVCRKIFMLPTSQLNWSNANGRQEYVNVLQPWNVLSSQEKERHPLFNKNNQLIEKIVNFKIFGGYNTLGEGAPIDGIDEGSFIYRKVGFPKYKANRLISALEKRGCSVELR